MVEIDRGIWLFTIITTFIGGMGVGVTLSYMVVLYAKWYLEKDKPITIDIRFDED